MDKKLNLKYILDALGFVKASHWMAEKHSHHVVLDELYKTLDKKFDEYVEAFAGCEGELIYSTDTDNEKFEAEFLNNEFVGNESDPVLEEGLEDEYAEMHRFIKVVAKAVNKTLDEFDEVSSSLASIHDDIKQAFEKADYLLKMA